MVALDLEFRFGDQSHSDCRQGTDKRAQGLGKWARGVATPPSGSGDLGNANSKFLLQSSVPHRDPHSVQKVAPSILWLGKGKVELSPYLPSCPLCCPTHIQTGTWNRYGCLLITKLVPELRDWFPSTLVEWGNGEGMTARSRSRRKAERATQQPLVQRSPTVNWPWLFLTWMLLNIPFAHTFFI